MKKVVKIIIILMVLLTCSISMNKVYATKWSSKDTEWWNPNYGYGKDVEIGEDEIMKKANIITTALRNVGIAVSVIALMLIGIKEMTAGVEEKTELKKALPGYLLGILLVVTVSVLPSIIYNFAKDF